MMTKTINFDMDGTIANLYAVENWLSKLRAFDASPYKDAAPLVHLSTLARYIHKAQNNGYKVNIVSWLSKEPNVEYDKAVTDAKMNWLKKHLPSVKFDEVLIVPYGTPKHALASGILFDDEKGNRDNWEHDNKSNKAYGVDAILATMKEILA